MSKSSKKLLIIEKSVEERAQLKEFLGLDEDSEYAFFEAESGAEGLDICIAENPDCVLLGCPLPDEDCLIIHENFSSHEITSKIPVIILTSQNDELRIAAAGVKKNFQNYLLKGSFTPAQLQLSIRYAIDFYALQYKDQDSKTGLESAQEKMVRAAKDAGIGTFDWNIKTGKIYWSNETENSAALTAKDFDNSFAGFMLFVHPEDRVKIQQRIEAAFGNGDYECEFRMLKRDGTFRWVIGKGRVVFDEDGKPARLTGVDIDISKRKIEEEALRASQSFTNSLIETVPSVMYTLNLETKANTFLNGQASKALGYPLAELQNSGLNFIEKYMHPKDLAAAEKHFSKIIEAHNGEVFEFEYRMRHMSGEWRWFRSRDKVFRRDADGRAKEILGIATDVTERKRAKEALRESEDRYRAFVQASAQIEWTADAAGKFVKKQPSWAAFTGQTIDEYKDAGWLEAVHPDDQERVAEAWQLAVRNKDLYEVDERVRRLDGKYRWVQARAVPILDQSGAVLEWIGTSTDITERKRDEERLEESEKFIRSTLNSLVSSIAILNRDGVILEVNEAWKEFAAANGYTKVKSGIGENYLSVVQNAVDSGEPNAELILAGITEVINKKAAKFVFEYPCDTPNEQRWFLMNVSPLLTARSGVVISHTEITGRKQAEKHLQRNHETFFNLVKNNPFGIYIIDNDFRLIEISAGSKQFFRGVEPLIGRDFAEILRIIWNEPFASEAIAVFRHTLETGEPYHAYDTVEQRSDIATFESYDWKIERITLPDGGFGVVCYFYNLTAQKQIQEKLRQSEQRLRLATEAAEMFSWETNIGAQTIKWSENAAQIIGCRPEDLPDSINDAMFFVATDERERIFKIFEDDLLAGKTNYVIDFRGKENQYWQAHGLIVRDADGMPSRVFGVTQNISKRKIAEEKIETANYRFRVAEEAVKGFIYEWNLKTGEVTRSDSVERVIGFRREELEKNWQSWHDLIHPDDRIVNSESEAVEFVKKLDGESFGGEYRLRHKMGEHIWVLERAIVVRDEHGVPYRVIGQTIDISDRKESEEKLLDAERRAVRDYRDLLARIAPLAQTLGAARELSAICGALLAFICFEAPCEGFFVSFYDEENQLKRVRYAWINGVELEPEQMAPIPLFKTDGANSRAIRTRKSIVTTRELDKMDGLFEVVGEDDRSRPTYSLVTPMIVSGRVTGTLEVQNHAQKYRNEHVVALEMAAGLAAISIENVRLLNIEAQARAAAEESSRAKDNFLAVLSHELRTPLNSIKGWVSILQNQRLDEEKLTRAIEVIARAANSQNALIEDILDVSRIISGKMRLEVELLSFVSLLQNAVDAMRPNAERKNIALEIDFDATADEMHGDAFRLQQVINNLLNNAIKFTPPHGIIKISLKREDNTAELIVADSGIGITPELLPHIFDRFQQAELTSSRKYGGLGLGLAIVHSLVEMHGGTISVTSVGEGEGAAFTVRLPLISQMIFPSPEPHQLYESLSTAERTALLKGLKLLVVDDDADTLEMMRFALESFGASVVVVKTAEEALNILSENNFHLLISDIGMAEIDGYGLLKSIRESLLLSSEVLPAIAFSGYVSVDDRERAAKAGFQMHLGKPIDLDSLPSLILRLLKS